PSKERPAESPRALGGEVEREAETEEAVDGPDGAQVRGAGREDARIDAEETEPRARREGRAEADRLRDRGRHERTRPRHAHRARPAARANVGADHRDERRAEAEHDGNLQIFQAHTDAVAGEGDA